MKEAITNHPKPRFKNKEEYVAWLRQRFKNKKEYTTWLRQHFKNREEHAAWLKSNTSTKSSTAKQQGAIGTVSRQNISTTTKNIIVNDSPSLWHQNSIILGAFLLSPICGAYLTAKNWKELGEDYKARNQIIWIYTLVAFYIAIGAALYLNNHEATGSVALPSLFIWYYGSSVREQKKYVEDKYGTDYGKNISPNISIWYLFIAIFVVVSVIGVMILLG